MAVKKVEQTQSSYSEILKRFNSLANAYSSLPMDSVYSAFSRAMGGYWANSQPIQNQRVKAINPLPCDYSKADLGQFLQNPQNSELQLQQVAEGLKWSVYSFFKLQKSYADMLTFKYYAIPQYVDKEDIKSEQFKREYRLVDKILKAINIPQEGHKLVGQAITQGKVFYVPRYSIDKSHNKVNYFLLQQLPTGGGYTKIIGLNNISKYTISFNLMYFLQLGTDYRQFGDLFEPYMQDFLNWQTEKTPIKGRKKYVYASRNNAEFESDIKAWQQNGSWFYYVTLPVDRVWTFEIDDTTPIVASPLSGLFQTFAQQADYEAAQLSLILNPLIKIFTGEIPYNNTSNATQEDSYKLSIGGRAMFEAFWNSLMSQTNTGGTAFFTAPVENIKSHDYAEASNANSVSNSFLTYSSNKVGLNALIPVNENPHQGVSEYSAKLESKYPQCIYRTLENMINNIFESLNLQFDWETHIFGDIYSEDAMRANALKELSNGDISQYFILAALNNQSILDKAVMCDLVKSVELIDKLQAPQTAYTQSGKSQPKSQTGGAPEKDQTQVEETKIEKQTEVIKDE